MARRDKYEDAETYTVCVSMEIQATSAKDAASTARSAVKLRKAVSTGQSYGDVFVQRVERPLKRVEQIEVVRTGDPVDGE